LRLILTKSRLLSSKLLVVREVAGCVKSNCSCRSQRLRGRRLVLRHLEQALVLGRWDGSIGSVRIGKVRIPVEGLEIVDPTIEIINLAVQIPISATRGTNVDVRAVRV